MKERGFTSSQLLLMLTITLLQVTSFYHPIAGNNSNAHVSQSERKNFTPHKYKSTSFFLFSLHVHRLISTTHQKHLFGVLNNHIPIETFQTVIFSSFFPK